MLAENTPTTDWVAENGSRHRPPALPEKQRRIGSVTVEWIPAKPGEAAILCEGGTIDDRWLAEVITREELAACGIRQARFTFDGPSAVDYLDELRVSVPGGRPTHPANPLQQPGTLSAFYSDPGDPTSSEVDFAQRAMQWARQTGNPVNGYPGIKGNPQSVTDALKSPENDFGHVYYDYTDASKTSKDKCSWVPGQNGKGIMEDDGTLHMWRTGDSDDGDPWHDHYAQAHGIGRGHKRFQINPNGNVSPYGGGGSPSEFDADQEQLMQKVNQHYPQAQYQESRYGPPVYGDDEDWEDESAPELTRSQINSPWRVTRTAHWDDIMAKSKRLIQSGNVTLLRNGFNNIVAHVIGDHGEYQCEISRDDPESRAITQWTCECPWDQYAFQRTRQWKKYEARPCAHVLAAYWKSQGTPLDEDAPPGASPAGGVPGKDTPFPPPGGPPSQPPLSPQMPQDGPGQGLQPGPDGGAMPGLPPAAQMEGPPQLGPPSALPPVGNPPTQPGLNPAFMPPAATGLIPPYPLEPAPQPVSVPGARPGPYPANPIQQPGTFSHTILMLSAAQFVPDSRARLNEATLGTSVGREGATDAGQWMEIPEGANVEIVYQDPSTGWVEVRWPLKGGPMTSYHVECFVEPEKLSPLAGDSPMAPQRRSSMAPPEVIHHESGYPMWSYNWRIPFSYDHDNHKLHVGAPGDTHMEMDSASGTNGRRRHGMIGLADTKEQEREGYTPGMTWLDTRVSPDVHEAVRQALIPFHPEAAQDFARPKPTFFEEDDWEDDDNGTPALTRSPRGEQSGMWLGKRNS